MRFLIGLFLVLVLLNVAAYLWPDKTNYAPHVQTEKEDINANYVRLNKEIEDDYYRRTASGEEEALVSSVGGDQKEAVQANRCYRVGPFVHKENFELAQALLLDASIEYKKAQRESKETNVFRVYLGPYAGRAEAIDTRTDLRRKNILDHFIRKNDKEQYIVSLGIYTTKESLDDAVRLFSQTLDDVKFGDELVLLPESYWLYFSLEDENSALQKLRQVDWGERAAKMGKFQCQT